MRTRLLVLLIAVLTVVPAISNAGFMGLYPGTANGDYQDSCNLVEQGSGLRYVAVVLRAPALINSYLGASSMKVYSNDVTWIPLSLTSPWTVVGSPDNFSVSFGACQSAPVVVATVTYLDFGSTPCGRFFLGGVGFQDVLVRCDGTNEPTGLNGVTINGVYDAPPGAPDPDCYCPIVSTQQSTWAQVKSLYRN